MLSGASDGVIDILREVLFILVTAFHVLVVDIIAVDERKIDVYDHRTETWRSGGESQSVCRSLWRLCTAGEKFHAQLPDLVGAGSPCKLP